MTATTITRPRATSENRWRTADQHILALPAAAPDEEAQEQELARRAVQRLAGHQAIDILDALGLLIPEPPKLETVPTPEPTKRCTRCKETKPRDAFTRCSKTSDGLYQQCRDCRNAGRRALYARRGYREAPDGNIEWQHAAPGGYGVPSSREAVERRINTWADLRVEQRLAPRKAAERMAICMRTARRYDRILKDRGLLPQTDSSGRAVAAE